MINSDWIAQDLTHHANAIKDLDARLKAVESKLATKPLASALKAEAMRALPPDVADAVESCKLAIIRHRADDWHECSQHTFVEVFRGLAEMVQRETTDG